MYFRMVHAAACSGSFRPDRTASLSAAPGCRDGGAGGVRYRVADADPLRTTPADLLAGPLPRGTVSRIHFGPPGRKIAVAVRVRNEGT